MNDADFQYARIMLVEDDDGLADLTASYLRKQGYDVDRVADGLDAVEQIPKRNPDLVVLDIMLPGMDGMAVCRKVRPVYKGPILFLTARDDQIDEILGLELGADDYLAKPVEPRLLLARIRAHLRRRERAQDSESDAHPESIIIDEKTHSVAYQDQWLELSQPEFQLLNCLYARAGEVVSRDEIMLSIRGIEHDGLSRTVDILVSDLRKKLPDGEWIKTIRGRGYLWAK